MLASRDHLLATHDEFRKLAQEHTQYEQRLSSLTHKRYLTDDEKLEEVRLKKLKLRLKDQMESIERQYRDHVTDGKVTSVDNVKLNGKEVIRISIFLNVFDVHVNRSPIAGVIRAAHYQEGKFLNAMNPACAEYNEQNTVTIEGDGHSLVFKQIAGLLARRLVFTKEIGETVARGERIGMMKFGSRMDVLLGQGATIQVKVGDRVKGGSSILAFLNGDPRELAAAGQARASGGGH